MDSNLENPASARLVAQPRRRASLTSRRDVAVAATPLVDTFTDFFKQLAAGASKNAKEDTSGTVESLLALVSICSIGITRLAVFSVTIVRDNPCMRMHS